MRFAAPFEIEERVRGIATQAVGPAPKSKRTAGRGNRASGCPSAGRTHAGQTLRTEAHN
jgi:hypothetical protein